MELRCIPKDRFHYFEGNCDAGDDQLCCATLGAVTLTMVKSCAFAPRSTTKPDVGNETVLSEVASLPDAAKKRELVDMQYLGNGVRRRVR